MKKLIALSLIALVFNSFCILAQTGPRVSEKDFAAAMDAYASNTMKQLPDLPAVAVVVIKDESKSRRALTTLR